MMRRTIVLMPPELYRELERQRRATYPQHGLDLGPLIRQILREWLKQQETAQ